MILGSKGDTRFIGTQYGHAQRNLHADLMFRHSSLAYRVYVVYKPLYENPAAHLFTRSLREWDERVEWNGGFMKRFVRLG